MASYDPRKHPQWANIREAIKRELVTENYDGKFKRWSEGWEVPRTDTMADAMLDGLADVTVEAAFALDQVVHK